MTKTTANAVVTVKRELFDLKLPPEFNLSPKWVVEMPNKWKVNIYETQIWNDRYTNGKQTDFPVPGWRAVVVTSRGHTSNQYNGNKTTSDPLELHLWLKSVAQELSKRSSTKTTVHMIDGSDFDE